MIIERLLDNSPAAMMASDLDERIIHANHQWLDNFARSCALEDVIGTLWSDYFPTVVCNDTVKRHDEIVKTGQSRDYDLTISVQGSVHVFLVHKFAIYNGEDAKIIAIGTVATDITARRREQARVAAKRDHSERLEAIGEFAAGLAHDFNNLLAVIEMNAGFARRDNDQSSLLFDLDMDAIEGATQSGAALVDSLATFGRRQPGDKERLIVREMAQDLTEMFRRLLDSKIKIRTVHDGGKPWYVIADRAQVERMLINLVMNARDAMPDGGRLTIEITKLLVDESRYVRIRVTDTGEGMPDEIRTKIFEPFFTTKPRGKGSGLGLATVYGVVHEMGGQIEVVSIVAQGTTFTVCLPAFDPVELDALAVNAS